MASRSILRTCFLRCALLVVAVRTEEVFNTTPPAVRTSFSCLNRPMGFYADVEANCRVYHMCDDHGNKFSYRCPEETAFRQDALICDHAHLVDCQATVYPSTRPSSDQQIDNAHPASSSTRYSPGGSLDDNRPSFSRSFQVVQRSDKSTSTPNKLQSGFVFSANSFLKDQDDRAARERITGHTARMCNSGPKNRIAPASLADERFGPWRPRDGKPIDPNPSSVGATFSQSLLKNHALASRDSSRSFEPPIANPSPVGRPPSAAPSTSFSQHASIPRENSPPQFGYNGNNNNYHHHHPYSETLRSMQLNARVNSRHEATTRSAITEIPVHALTLSLQPLMPNELEHDPYYPKQPMTTEAYYTPSVNRGKVDADTRRTLGSVGQLSPPLLINARPNGKVPFEIPSVLPDLNTLEDLVDRRKLFYIPRATRI